MICLRYGFRWASLLILLHLKSSKSQGPAAKQVAEPRRNFIVSGQGFIGFATSMHPAQSQTSQFDPTCSGDLSRNPGVVFKNNHSSAKFITVQHRCQLFQPKLLWIVSTRSPFMIVLSRISYALRPAIWGLFHEVVWRFGADSNAFCCFKSRQFRKHYLWKSTVRCKQPNK